MLFSAFRLLETYRLLQGAGLEKVEREAIATSTTVTFARPITRWRLSLHIAFLVVMQDFAEQIPIRIDEFEIFGDLCYESIEKRHKERFEGHELARSSLTYQVVDYHERLGFNLLDVALSQEQRQVSSTQEAFYRLAYFV